MTRTVDEGIRLENKNRKLLLRLERKLDLKRHLKKGKRHLDFGCGWGFFTKALAERYPQMKIVGFDLDCEKIKNANNYRRLRNVRYVCFDKIAGRYDSISLKFVLHEVEELNSFLGKVYKALKKSGKVIVYDFRKVSKENFRRLYDKGGFGGTFEKEYAEHNKWTLKDFGEIMRNANFKKIKLRSDGNHIAYLGEKND